MHPFTDEPAESVSALGEQKLIEAIRRWLGSVNPPSPRGIGDDCAVLPPARRAQLITVDPVVYPYHIDDSVPPRDAGAKLLKRNLSDIASMGGRPTFAVLSLVLDGRTRLAWLEAFYRGLAATARKYDVQVVGGDIAQSKGSAFTATLTLLGETAGPRALTRRGARLGDRIYVTGALGQSLVTGHHYKFTPRVAEGMWLANQPGVHAMTDISDGLAKDLRALTPDGTTPALDAAALPRRAGADVATAISEGEDYELVFALSAKVDAAAFARAWRRKFPRTRLSCIGRFVRAGTLPPGALDLAHYRGFEHLR